ncbi:MAG: hypothetical protein LH610_09340 [Sphingomonas bacterium]|nr:hypothetical protein [Sphingomonas bacterium]
MTNLLFDDHARRLRLNRALQLSGDLFLHARVFDDCVDRLADMRAGFSSALIVGCRDPRWPETLAAIVPNVSTVDPGSVAPQSFDLCLSIGVLESANDVQTAALVLRHILRPGGLLVGAIVGGNSLPRLRAAMRAGAREHGGAAPRLHPSIDGPSLAALLTSVGFQEPVIDVDRVDVAYPDLDRLVGDLRAMGCTNVLTERSRRPITRHQRNVVHTVFGADGSPTIERFELLHFAAWAPED